MTSQAIKWLVLGTLARAGTHPGRTAPEIARRTQTDLGQVRSRLVEMRRAGLVVEHGARVRSTDTGRMVSQWAITAAGETALKEWQANGRV